MAAQTITIPAPVQPMNPADVDQLCQNYEELKAIADNAKAAADKAKAQVMGAVEQRGYRITHHGNVLFPEQKKTSSATE